jgi:hypothetical protein
MTPLAPTPVPTFLPPALVRLLERHGDVPAHSLGRIIGRFAREKPTYIVNFGLAGVIEVRGDEILAAA